MSPRRTSPYCCPGGSGGPLTPQGSARRTPYLPSAVEPSVQVVLRCPHPQAVSIARPFSSMKILPGKTWPLLHSWALIVSPGRLPTTTLRHVVKAFPSRVRISSGPAIWWFYEGLLLYPIQYIESLSKPVNEGDNRTVESRGQILSCWPFW